MRSLPSPIARLAGRSLVSLLALVLFAVLLSVSSATAQPSLSGLKFGGPSAGPGGADEGAMISPMLDVSALQPGKSARVALVLDFKPGFHSQSHEPIGPGLVPTTVTLDGVKGLTFGKPVYPPGVKAEDPILGPQSYYKGRTVLYVPVTVAADVSPGDINITGKVNIQICDESTCFPPTTIPVSFAAKVVGAGEVVTPIDPQKVQVQVPATQPTTKPVGNSKAKLARRSKAANSLEGYSLPAVFGIAFVVGLLFNVVPCVLPVLPLKAVGFYETAQHNRAKSVTYGLAFSLGVVASFAVLGLLVVVFKVVAWGELFSNQWFSGTLAFILLLMALNMFGLFTVNLPAGVYSVSPRHDTYFGNVQYGVLTAALSTPCTFGLFVSVLGVALAQPAVIGMLLICSVGAGMAAPYLVLSATPELARKFPRTGPWAELVKQFMGFLLLAVALFFAMGMLMRVVPSHFIWWAIFGVVASGGLFLVLRTAKYAKTSRGPIIAAVIALVIVAPAFVFAKQLAVKPYTWQPYSPTALADARKQGKIVLVDFTASWCTNCHLIEATVLNDKDVQKAVYLNGVVMMKADLTDTAAEGWDLLKNKLAARGVPLTAVYAPNEPEPIKLEGFFSVDDLIDELNTAAAK